LLDATAGCIRIDDTDIRAFTLESLRAQISVVQQDSVLFGLSIADNIRYGRPEASDEEVRAAAQAAALDEFVARLPDGYDKVISERGSSLSGGQRQRVAIARALVRRSPILILDEPTTGLDPETRHAVLSAIRQLTNDTTTLLVTHDIELARKADQILVLAHGHMVGLGPYTHLLATCAHFRRLAGAVDGRRSLVALRAPHVTVGAANDHKETDETRERRSTEKPPRAALPDASTPSATEANGTKLDMTTELAPIQDKHSENIRDLRGATTMKPTDHEQEQRVRQLVFFPYGNRYLLTDREAPLPRVGSEVFLDKPTACAYIVTKLSASPIPRDERLCAYLERLPQRPSEANAATVRLNGQRAHTLDIAQEANLKAATTRLASK